MAGPSGSAESASSPFAVDGEIEHYHRSIDSRRCEER